MRSAAALVLGCVMCSPLTSSAQELATPALTAPAADAAAGKRGVLVPLYVSFGVLQALDFQSTRRALDTGAREANPVMNGIVGSPVGFVALKAAAGAAVIVASEKMRPRNRVAALATMVALNGVYAAIVSHNYTVGRR